MAEQATYTFNDGGLRSKIILFDLDGTLIDSTEAILESFTKAYESFGMPVPAPERIKSYIGLPLDVMFVNLGVDESEAMAYVTAYKDHYKTIHTQKTTLLPHAKEAIEHAHSYARLGVVTTKTSEYSRILLEHFGVMKYFDVLIGRDDVENPKPHPEPVYKAMRALEHRFGKVTYLIGDTVVDMQAAEEAGIGSIAVLCGYGKEDELDEYADFLTPQALDAVKMIENL